MTIYLIPIFCFGVVITGIVMLGVQEATNRARQIAAAAKVSGHTLVPRKEDPGSRV